MLSAHGSRGFQVYPNKVRELQTKIRELNEHASKLSRDPALKKGDKENVKAEFEIQHKRWLKLFENILERQKK